LLQLEFGKKKLSGCTYAQILMDGAKFYQDLTQGLRF